MSPRPIAWGAVVLAAAGIAVGAFQAGKRFTPTTGDASAPVSAVATRTAAESPPEAIPPANHAADLIQGEPKAAESLSAAPSETPAVATAPMSTIAPAPAATAAATQPVDPARLASVAYASVLPPASLAVDSLTGQPTSICTDLSISAGPFVLEVVRTYDPSWNAIGLLGRCWRLNWERVVARRDDLAAIREGNSVVMLRRLGSGDVYRSTAGDELAFSAGGAVRTKPDGGIENYDAAGRLTEIDARNGNRVRLTYDQAGRLSRVEGPLGGFLQFVTSSEGLLSEVQSSTGNRVRYLYEGPSQPVRSSARRITYQYGDGGLLSRAEHPQTGAIQLTYDALGRVVERRFADDAAERFEYDDAARSVKQTDPTGRVAIIRRAADGSKIERTSPGGASSQIEFDPLGRPVSFAGPAGRAGRLNYDTLNRPIKVATAAHGAYAFEYQGNSSDIAAVISPDGRRLGFKRDAGRNLLSAQFDGDERREIERDYLPNGLVGKVRTRDDQEFTLTYDNRGQLESLSDSAGNRGRFEYDAAGRLTRYTDPAKGVLVRSYDDEGRLASITDAAGAKTTYNYNAAGFVASTIDALGSVTTYEYDARGRLVASTDPLGRATRYAYFPDGRLQSTTTPTGDVTRYSYDAEGRLAERVNPASGVTSFKYDPSDNLTALQAASGVVLRTAHDAAGRPTALDDASGVASRFEHDTLGRRTAWTDSYDQTTRYIYDARGNLIETRLPTGRAIQRKYDQADRLVELSDDGQIRIALEYDAAGNLARARTAAGHDTTYLRDVHGRIIEWKDNTGSGGRTAYDPLGRPVEFSDATGASARLQYDAAGRLVRATNALGQPQRRTYDAAGQLIEVVEASGDAARYDYDQGGRIAKIRLPGGGERAYQYDPLGNPEQTTDALGNVDRQRYDAAGRLMSRTDALGQTTTFKYDDANRIAEKRQGESALVRYRYDAHGRLREIDDGVFPVRYAYDDRGRRTAIEYPAIRQTVNQAYDDRDRVISVAAGGRTIRYAYDEHDRLTSIDAGAGQIRLGYDARNRRTTIEYPNGVRATRAFDAAGRVSKLVYADRGGRPLSGTEYAYDSAGNETTATDVGGVAVTYRYDPANQLLEEDRGAQERTTYAYAPGGNRSRRQAADLKIAYEYDRADQLVKAGNETFKHDAAGNLIERTGQRGTTAYVYDADHRLTKVVLPDGKEVTYGYAPTGERIWREVDGVRAWFLTDGLEVLAELDGEFKPQALFVHGPGIDDVLAMIRGDDIYCLHPDRRGSVRSLTDAQARIAAHYEYDAFGRVITRQGDVASPFTYTGRELDEQTGLYYFRARWYDPALGRFLTRDPIAAPMTEPLALNQYQYVANNPLRSIDPLGAEGVNPLVTMDSPSTPPAPPPVTATSPPVTVSSPPINPALVPTIEVAPEPGPWPAVGRTPDWMKAQMNSPENIYRRGLDLGFDYYNDRSLDTMINAIESGIRNIHENFKIEHSRYQQRGLPTPESQKTLYFECLAEEVGALNQLQDEAVRRSAGQPPADDYFKGLRDFEARFPPELPPEARPPAPVRPSLPLASPEPAANGSLWSRIASGTRGARNAFLEPTASGGNVALGVVNGALIPANMIMDVYGDNMTLGESFATQGKHLLVGVPIMILAMATGTGEVVLVVAVGATIKRGYDVLSGEAIIIPPNEIAVARDPNFQKKLKEKWDALHADVKGQPLSQAETKDLMLYLENLPLNDQPQLVAVPPVEGMTPDSASGAVTGATLKPDPIMINPLPENVKPSVVFHQQPKPGSLVPVDSSVTYYYGLGKPEEMTVTVPNLVTMIKDQAEAVLADDELKLKAAPSAGDKKPSPNNKRMEVYEQSPQAGTKVAAGSTVSFRYYAGIKVENYIGLTRDEATKAISKDLLTPDVQEGDAESENPAQRRKVYKQQPQQGEYVWFGDTIEARYYKFAEGFRDGDGAKVDGRVAAATVSVPKDFESLAAAGTGTVIHFNTGPQAGNNETAPLISWSIMKCGDAASASKLLGDAVKALPAPMKIAGFTAEVKSGGNGYEFTTMLNSSLNKATAHGRMSVYRDQFVISYGFVVPQFGADVSHSAGIIERSQKLVDLRFPPD